jgi:hypothetical protein
MMPQASDAADLKTVHADLRHLFHRLNNQLGIILAHAELIEAKAPDETSRARAAQVLASTLEAMGTVKEIRHKLGAVGT